MTKVNLRKTVNYDTLETALVKAAKDIGWKTKIKDEFEKVYNLGSVKEAQVYDCTRFFLRGKLFNAMNIAIYGKTPTDYFFVNRGFASEKRVQEYLSAVSKYL